MTVVVTGANGFVGRHVCERLLADGESVRAVVRRDLVIGAVERIVVPDLTAVRWAPIVQGSSAVIHLAARVHESDARQETGDAYMRINRDATIALARSAAESGVKHFVYVSSVKAAADESGERALNENDRATPETPYGVSKRQAEEALESLRPQTSMIITIIRPPLVYGPGVRANFFRLMQLVERGVPLPLARISNQRSLIYVGNVVDALTRCIRSGARESRTFYVSDGPAVSTPDLIRALARAFGRRPMLFPVPVSLIKVAGSVMGKASAVQRLTGSLAVDISLIRNTLGWTPPYTMEEGLAATAAWYRSTR